MEVTGMLAVAAVFTGSVLVALFASEALITWTIRAMDAGVKRAEARRLSAQPHQTPFRSAAEERPAAWRTAPTAATSLKSSPADWIW